MIDWLIVEKVKIIGSAGDKFYSYQYIPVLMSSTSCETYEAAWYRRSSALEDPWVSILDHADMVVYGGNGAQQKNDILKTSGGMNVYIRNVAQ